MFHICTSDFSLRSEPWEAVLTLLYRSQTRVWILETTNTVLSGAGSPPGHLVPVPEL